MCRCSGHITQNTPNRYILLIRQHSDNNGIPEALLMLNHLMLRFSSEFICPHHMWRVGRRRADEKLWCVVNFVDDAIRFYSTTCVFPKRAFRSTSKHACKSNRFGKIMEITMDWYIGGWVSIDSFSVILLLKLIGL